MDRQLLHYLPSFLREFQEFQLIHKVVEQNELEQAWKAIERVLNEVFISTSSEYGLSRMEKILSIKKLDTDEIETRVFRILLKLNEVLPYTYRTIKRHLDEICGEAEYELQVHPDEFTIDAIFEIEERQKLVELGRYLDEVLPANLVIFFAKRSRLEFAVPILYKNILKMRSEFYPRANIPYLKYDGTARYDGSVRYSKYKSNERIELYPIKLNMKSEVKPRIIFLPKIQMKSIFQVPIKVEHKIICQKKFAIDEKVETKISIKQENVVLPRYEIKLKIGKHPNKYDGTARYDGRSRYYVEREENL